MENQTEHIQPPGKPISQKNKQVFLIVAILVLIFLAGRIGYMLGKNANSLESGGLDGDKSVIPSTASHSPTQQVNQATTPTNGSQTNKLQKQILPVWTPSASDPTDPRGITNYFYNWYSACTSLNSAANTGLTFIEACPIEKTGVLTDSLVNQLQQPVDSNPVLCAQNIVPYVTIDNKAVVTNNGTATIAVYQEPYHSQGDKSYISVGLQKIQNQWKITSIKCVQRY